MARASIKNQALLTEPELRARLGELYASIDQFNRRWYFQSHETLEDLWMVTPLPERDLFQAIIQMAAAFVHFVRGEYPGVLKLLDASIEKLREFTPSTLGIDTGTLLRDVERVRNEIASLGPKRFGEFNEESRAPNIAFKPER